MPLPKLETPTYTLQIPSTKETIEFRPFLVKEEKILIQAQEGGDEKDIIRAIKNIVRVCTFEKINVDELTTYDLEYIFLQLRARSIGETVEFKLKCLECEKYNTITLDITKAEVVFPQIEVDKKISLSESVGVILKHISVKDIDIESNNITSLLIASIDSIYDDETVYPAKDCTKKELEEFVDSLSHSNLEKIQEFVQNQPKLKQTIRYKCEHCGHENEIVLSGLADFFT